VVPLWPYLISAVHGSGDNHRPNVHRDRRGSLQRGRQCQRLGRRAAGKLAAKLQAVGLKKLPDFLIDYSVGDYSGMCNKIHSLAELFLDGDTAVLTEMDTVFQNVLTAKLATEEGRAYIAAKLAEVTKAITPVVAAAAPVVAAAATAAVAAL